MRRTTRAPELDGRRHLVVDLPRRARLKAMPLPAIITGGAAESPSKGYYGVPKRGLTTGLQVLPQRGGLQIGAGLKRGPELVVMRVKVGCEGRTDV